MGTILQAVLPPMSVTLVTISMATVRDIVNMLPVRMDKFSFNGLDLGLGVLVCVKSSLKVIKLFSCSTELSMKFILLINVKMATIVGILTFISWINTTSESLKARKISVFYHFSFYVQLILCSVELSMKKFYDLRVCASSSNFFSVCCYFLQTILDPDHASMNLKDQNDLG